MIAFFADLQPGNVVLQRAARTSDDEREEMKESSKFLSNMVELMTVQYLHATLPDMSKGVIDVFPAGICAISPLSDSSCTPESLQDYRKLTMGDFQVVSIDAGHMDILKPAGDTKKFELFDKVHEDILSCFYNEELEAWSRHVTQMQQDLIFGRLPCKEPSAERVERALQRTSHWISVNPFATKEEIAEQSKSIGKLVDLDE